MLLFHGTQARAQDRGPPRIDHSLWTLAPAALGSDAARLPRGFCHFIATGCPRVRLNRRAFAGADFQQNSLACIRDHSDSFDRGDRRGSEQTELN
jgi:hypothetical protein